MIKLRLLLVAAALVSLALLGDAYYWNIVTDINYFSNVIGPLSMIMALPAPFMLFSALVMLSFSFLKVEERDGLLFYDRKNLYWKLMNRIYNWNESVSLCRAYWQTVWSVFIASIVFSVVFTVYVVFQSDRAVEAGWAVFKLLGLLGGGILLLFVLFILFIPLEALSKSKNILIRYISKTVLFLLIASGVLFLLYLLAQEGLVAVVLFVIIVCIFLTGLLVVDILKSLPNDNVLMRMLRSLKEDLCPIIAPM